VRIRASRDHLEPAALRCDAAGARRNATRRAGVFCVLVRRKACPYCRYGLRLSPAQTAKSTRRSGPRWSWLAPSPAFYKPRLFRIVLVYVLLFAFSVTALLFFTYWNTRRTMDAQTDQIIQADIIGLNEQYQHFGLPGLVETIRTRSLQQGQALYLWPTACTISWPAIWIPGRRSPTPRPAALSNSIMTGCKTASWRQGGPAAASSRWRDFMILVSQDVHDRYLTERMFTTTLPWTVLLILILGTIGGALMSRNVLRRLDTINRTSGEIMKGDLTRRVPLNGSGDEFDVLADNLNRMLDRIERLMKACGK